MDAFIIDDAIALDATMCTKTSVLWWIVSDELDCQQEPENNGYAVSVSGAIQN